MTPATKCSFCGGELISMSYHNDYLLILYIEVSLVFYLLVKYKIEQEYLKSIRRLL